MYAQPDRGLSGLGSTMAEWAAWTPGDPLPVGPVTDIQTQASVGGTTVAYDSPGVTSEQLRAIVEAPGYQAPTVPGLNQPSTPDYVWNEEGHAVPGYAVDFDAPDDFDVPLQVDAQGESASDAPYTPPSPEGTTYLSTGGGSPTGGGYPGGGSGGGSGDGSGGSRTPLLAAGLGVLALLLIARPGRR